MTTKAAPKGALTLRALGRATLARQMLLARESGAVDAALERLFAIQAQWPKPPYFALWSRLSPFRREALANAFHDKALIRATMMRATIHVMRAADYARMRGAMQPSLAKGLGALKGRTAGFDLDETVAAARAFFEERPRTFDALRDHFEAGGGGDVRAMAYAVRLHLPLVLVPSRTPWAFPASADFAVAEAWLGKAWRARAAGVEEIVLRYLAALGPATVQDAQSWTGLPALRATFESLRPKLVSLRDERGRELFDLPDAPRPPEDAPAPPRLLPEFDNVVLGHHDRTRFLDDAHRKAVFLPGLRVTSTFTIDGRVGGTWSFSGKKKAAAIELSPFATVPKGAKKALEGEAEALLRFAEPDADTYEVRFAKR